MSGASDSGQHADKIDAGLKMIVNGTMFVYGCQ